MENEWFTAELGLVRLGTGEVQHGQVLKAHGSRSEAVQYAMDLVRSEPYRVVRVLCLDGRVQVPDREPKYEGMNDPDRRRQVA